MADIGQVCRRPVFQIKIEIDESRSESSDFYRLISENGENIWKKIF